MKERTKSEIMAAIIGGEVYDHSHDYDATAHGGSFAALYCDDASGVEVVAYCSPRLDLEDRPDGRADVLSVRAVLSGLPVGPLVQFEDLAPWVREKLQHRADLECWARLDDARAERMQ